MKPKLYLGIDGGLNGGISGIDEEGRIKIKMVMPSLSSSYDVKELMRILSELKEIYDLKVLLEDVHIIPLAGNKTIAKMFELFGLTKGILFSLGISFQTIRALRWQRKLLKSLHAKNTKEASMVWCAQNYPEEDFRKSDRCRKPHDGITDSLCIANYLRYQEVGGKDVV